MQVSRGVSGLLLIPPQNTFFHRCAFSGGPREQNSGAGGAQKTLFFTDARFLEVRANEIRVPAVPKKHVVS